MRRLILIVFLASLAGCAATMQGYRREAGPLQALVGFEPSRFAGTWHEVAAIGRPPGARWSVTAGPNGALTIETTRDGTGQGRMTAPGRLRIDSFDAPLWVLWADADMRSVVFGTPNGSFAILLDRAARMPPDRMRAARGILSWNGYDLGALK